MLRVNRSTYYKHFASRPSARAQENRALLANIITIYSQSSKRLGAHKIRQRLLIEFASRVSIGRIYRLMRSVELPKMSTIKPRIHKTASTERCYTNVLKKQFSTTAPNIVWVSDITYVKVGSGFCYICVIIDLFARKVISYKCSRKIDTQLVIDTLENAHFARQYPSGVLFHSDRGVQYTAKAFRQLLERLNFVQSFSAKAHPYDNAVAESFFKYLKLEELNRRSFSSLNELNLSLFEYIEGFYNSRRPHSANSFLSPLEKERLYLSSITSI